MLRFVQGMSVSETAEIMGKNDGAIKAMQHRAIRKLAELVGPICGDRRPSPLRVTRVTTCATRRCIKWKYGGDGTVGRVSARATSADEELRSCMMHRVSVPRPPSPRSRTRQIPTTRRCAKSSPSSRSCGSPRTRIAGFRAELRAQLVVVDAAPRRRGSRADDRDRRPGGGCPAHRRPTGPARHPVASCRRGPGQRRRRARTGTGRWRSGSAATRCPATPCTG